MDVQIVSIPHTATHFTRNLLRDHGIEVFTDHLDNPELEYWTFERLVTPLRPPRDVALSWAKRHQKNRIPVDFGWDTMWPLLLAMDTHFFFLEYGDPALSKLSDYVGIPLSTDWKKVNGSTQTPVWFISENQIQMAEDVYNTLRGMYG